MENSEKYGMVTLREKTRQVFCGGVPIGGGAPVSIQSMTNTFTEDIAATAAQIAALAAAGADIVRCAVPTLKAAQGLREIKTRLEASGTTVPLVADVHFDYNIALAAIAAGVDKIRINPGNIGSAERLKAVADAAGGAGIPMRIGVNGGSIEPELRGLYQTRPAEALAESAFRSIGVVRGLGFEDLVVSIKSSNVMVNTEAHRLLSAAVDLPLHIGITEAGAGGAAVVKSAAGIGALLAMGIGDTIRVSLTGDPVPEIAVARDILRAVDLLPGQVSLISCPTCGRCRVDLAALCGEAAEALGEIERTRVSEARLLRRNGPSAGESEEAFRARLKASEQPVVAALMGCAVNGPGEASHADLGVACGADGGVLFKKGTQSRTLKTVEIVPALVDEVKRIVKK